MKEQFDEMSVIELRQKAKEMGVKLGAGINKQGIIDKLKEAAAQMEPAESPAFQAETAPEAAPFRNASIITDDEEFDDEGIMTADPGMRPSARPAAPRTPVPTGSAAPSGSSLSTISAKAPAFTMEGSRAWHNPRAYQSQSSYQRPQQAQSWNSRPAQPEQRAYNRAPSMQHQEMRPQQARPVQQPVYVNRFGPDQPPQETERPNEYRGYAPAQQDYPSRDSAPANAGGGYGYNPSYGHRENSSAGIAEILAAGECGDGEGVLEIHPDGYGFLRTNHYLPGKQDVYISNAQIRRFSLRTGDYVMGKTRPQREADRYSAMLYITEVNGSVPEEMPERPRFEDLTAIYPKRRITLTGKRESDLFLRMVDLFCPIGFGQRAMLVCPPRVDRLALLKKLAAAITRNYTKAQLMMLLVDERPEEVTDIKDAVKGEVVYATFDESPDSQVRVTEMAMERAMRMVEQKKDVIILTDSLTRLARASNAIAPQSARTLSGGLAAGALNKPKKFFGAARNTREGGSLTIIATMLAGTGNEMDNAILQEFRGNSNMTCILTPGAGKRLTPGMRLEDCSTIHDEWLLSENELALAQQLRALAAEGQPDEALGKVLDLLETAETNETLAAGIQPENE